MEKMDRRVRKTRALLLQGLVKMLETHDIQDISIKELTELVAKVVGYKGEIKWDPTKPVQFTQEEIWEHIHEIEKGPFYPIEEVHQRIRSWMDNYQGKK